MPLELTLLSRTRHHTKIAEFIERRNSRDRREAAACEPALDATHALTRGAELIMVRDNLRHSSISTTSTYLHNDEVQRTRQFDQAFSSRDSKL